MRADADEIYELHARLCKAIADPKRLLILNELREGPRAVGELAETLGLSQPNTSQHLAILRDRTILTTTRSGNTVYYELTSTKVIDAVDLLREFMAEYMTERGHAAAS
ncbi:MAG: metalloregulator ArsR/SmtB family transcription factor [Nitriliruptorales bacterium]|nr:metalloregulator ArsR/SmtB family transcription factor [Nitriliruptorales bacterium]